MEEGKEKFFHKIDQFIFEKLEEIKSRPEFSQFQDNLANLDEEVKTWVRVAATAAVYLIPLLLIAAVSLKVYFVHSEVKTRLDVLGHMNAITNSASQIAAVQRQSLSSVSINQLGDLVKEVVSSANSAGIDKSKLKASNFDQSTPFAGISKSEASVRFEKLNHAQLSTLLNSLTLARKMKVSELEITRIEKDSLLEGEFTLVHYGKNKLSK